MELEKIKCPSCGAETPIAENGGGFCLYCGAKISLPGCAVDAGDKIRQIYREYIEWVIKYFENTSSFTRSITSFFTGSNDFKRHENHNRFINDVRAEAQKLLSAYQCGSVPREELVSIIRFALLENHDRGISDAKWMFMAAEQFFEPMLPALTRDEAVRLYEEYRLLRKKDPGFPVQQKILKALKRMR